MKNNTKKNIIIFLAFIFVLIGLFLNEWAVARFFNAGDSIEFSNKIIVWFFDLFFIIFGLLLFALARWDKISLSVNLLMLFFTLVLCLAGAEIFLRLSEKEEEAMVSSEEFHHNLKPNYSYFREPTNYDEFGRIEYKTNSLGIRGEEIPEKEPGEYRIILLGDSFLEAEEIDFEKTIGQVLNDKLGRDKYTVIEHGVGSWSPLLELNWLLKTGLDLDPDLVIIFLCVNDFYSSYSSGDLAYTQSAVFDSNGLPYKFNMSQKSFRPRLLNLIKKPFVSFIEKQVEFSQQEIDYLLDIEEKGLESELNLIVPQNIENSSLIRDIIRLSRSPKIWSQETKETVSLSLNYLEKTREILKENGVSFALTFVPLPWNISQDENIIGRKHYGFSNVDIPMGGIEEVIKAYSQKNNVGYIDIYSQFKNFKQNNNEKLFLISDGHWNSKGHEIASQAVYNYLQSNY